MNRGCIAIKRAASGRSPALTLLGMLLVVLLLSACAGEAVAVPTPVATLAAATMIEATATAEPTATDATEETAAESAAASPEATADAVAPRVFFRQPTNHAILPITSTIVMGFEGVEVEPAGEVREGAGHMHILVDAEFIAPGEVIPKDEQHLHFGDGSLATELALSPGVHTVRLQFADGAHVALEGDAYRSEAVVVVEEDAPAQAVRFVYPTDGATVPPQVDLLMAASGLIVEPAGEVAEQAGHLHVLVDTDFIEPGQVIPKDEQHLHFGGGQLSAQLDLAPGEHTLRLQFADGAHMALEGEQYRDEIVVQVEEDAPSTHVMFVSPADEATVPPTFEVLLGATGLVVEPAGLVLPGGRGHLHLLVDTDFVQPGEVIPKDEQHIHLGGGQLATELTLEPGEHVLRLQMADGAHSALAGDQFRDEITVRVAEQ